MLLAQQFLLIDDDASSNFLCKLVIERTFNNARIKSFTRSTEAVKYLQNDFINDPVPTIVFLDINMPVLSGWEVLDVVERFDDEIKKDLSVFMLSSSINPNDREKARSIPLIVAYLEKPLSKDKLKEVMGLMKLMMW
jgi:CheY-like chemotaxis protein